MGDRFPDRLRDVLPSVGAELGLKDAVGAGRVWASWTTIVGEQIAAHAEPTSLRDGVLRVRAESPSWATEIAYLAGDIRRRVNESVGRDVVREIKVWTGPGTMRRSDEARGEHTSQRGEREKPQAPPAEDPRTALASARQAWEKARARGSKGPRSDPGEASGPKGNSR